MVPDASTALEFWRLLQDNRSTFVTMHYPLVLLLVVIHLQARRIFQTDRYGLIALGWALNLAYLICHNNPQYHVGAVSLDLLETPLALLGSASFLVAARGNAFPPPLGRLLSRPASRLIVPPVLATLVYLLIAAFPDDAYPRYLVRAVPRALFNFCAVQSLSQIYSHTARTVALPGWSGFSLSAFSTTCYAVLQFAALLLGATNPPRLATVSEGVAFLLGLLLKFMIILGLLRLIADAVARLRELDARASESEHTIRRIAHELGTPLGELIVRVRSMQEQPTATTWLKNTATALGSATTRIAAIVDAARNVAALRSIISSAAVPQVAEFMTARTVSLNTLVEAAVMAVKETRDENVIYHVQYAGNCCVHCVPGVVIQAFINIFRNAHDAMPNGKGSIYVVTTTAEDSASGTDQEYAVATIRDTGEGLTDEVARRMFEDGFTTRGGAGRGIGMGVIQDAVATNSGNLAIANATDVERGGTRVVIRFPRVPCGKIIRRDA